MFLKPFKKLPPEFQNETVEKYYNILDKKRLALFGKRVLDILLSVILFIVLIIPIIIISIIIKCSSKGPVFYKQKRVTKYGKEFNILKFRTMHVGADKKGPLLTCGEDKRVTSIGETLRKFRLDELPQVFHVLSGKMSIVGTRPEVPKFVKEYTDEMMATLLMPAGITSLASIMYKDENKLLKKSKNPNKDYIEKILPEKMKYNLEYILKFGVFYDIKLMLKTVKEVII